MFLSDKLDIEFNKLNDDVINQNIPVDDAHISFIKKISDIVHVELLGNKDAPGFDINSLKSQYKRVNREIEIKIAKHNQTSPIILGEGRLLNLLIEARYPTLLEIINTP